jgi:hypothetical protein
MFSPIFASPFGLGPTSRRVEASTNSLQQSVPQLLKVSDALAFLIALLWEVSALPTSVGQDGVP